MSPISFSSRGHSFSSPIAQPVEMSIEPICIPFEKSAVITLLDLPDELLIGILKKLDNVDVLYSLFSINNYHLYTLAMSNVFTNTLKFVTASSIDGDQSISDTIIERLCIDILPQVGHQVQYLMLEPISMERIFHATHYPNLTRMKLFNFGQDILLRYFTDDSTISNILKCQITDLVLVNKDNYSMITSLKTYTIHVYDHLLTFFKHLNSLTIDTSSSHDYPPLSLADVPSTTFLSTILTQLTINLSSFDDCFVLLDGRLKQLSILIVKIPYITHFSIVIVQHTDDLPTLKVFSLTCYDTTIEYDDRVVPLLRRMSRLEKLTLYLRVCDRDTFINGSDLYNDILTHMPRLYSFTFYIATVNTLDGFIRYLSDEDVQRTFTNIGLQQVACIVNYFRTFKAICHTFSLPFAFTRLENIANRFPTIIFPTVTYLKAYDVLPFQHEFFHRIAQAFPSLKDFCIMNYMPQPQIDHPTHSVVEYPHLTSLDIKCVHWDYIEEFLLETKTYVPCLMELKVNYDQLRSVTHNFTRESTRRNCLQVKRLIIEDTFAFSNEVLIYFPSL